MLEFCILESVSEDVELRGVRVGGGQPLECFARTKQGGEKKDVQQRLAFQRISGILRQEIFSFI